MKIVYKIFYTILCVFVFLPFIYADDPCSEENLQAVFKEKNITKENDKTSIRQNCYMQNGIKVDYQGNKVEFKGCTIDNKDARSSYDKAGKIGGVMNAVSWSQLNPDPRAITGIQRVYFEVDENLPVTKNYYVVSVKDNKVRGVYFAGCYEGYLQQKYIRDGVENTGTYIIVPKSKADLSITSKPVYYVKVLKPKDNGKCNTSAVGGGDVFLPKGIKLKYNAQDEKYNFYTDTLTTLGVENNEEGSGGDSGYGFQKYDFNGCPKYFNLASSFPTWWTASRKNAFIFSDSLDISYNISWIRTLFTEDPGTATGTTETSTEEEDRVTKCYDDIASTIVSKYTCDDFKSFAEKIYKEQVKCNDEHSNLFRDVDEEMQTKMLQKTVKALNKRVSNIVSCQLSTCNVANGSLVNKVSESNLPSCLESCVGELKISKTLEGNTYTNNCAACYKTFYNDLKSNNLITEDQKTCLDSQVEEYNKQLNKMQSNFQEIINGNMHQATDDHATATASTTVTYTKFDPPEINGGIFGRGGDCSQILGTNGVKILNGVITTIRIGAAIVAIINAMIILVPVITTKDADGLKKASSKCVKLAVILAVIEIFPSVIKLIGALFGWDACGIN